MQEERALRTIAVVGAGIVGLSAAIAFARALPKVRVTVLVSPPDPAALADRLSGTLTSVHGFHVVTGIEESELVRLGAATHRLGTRFEHWSADGAPWYHAYGDYGRDGAGIGFHNLWVQARRSGRAGPFDRYSAAALLAEAGKFVHPSEDPQSPLSTYSYALRLDPERYRELLLQIAARARLARIDGSVAAVERREDGGVAAILLGNGRRLEADLFVDCGGPSAPLLSRIDDRFEDWSRWHAADRLLIGAAANPEGVSSCDSAVASSLGWRWTAPLGERKLVTFAYAAALTGEARAR
ncbi:MAG: tryptophan 7-halogenase, partial [Pseudomonadota bacterium]|nr:tryptophan 7-halogenase [Pseudomonadota bacterium]